MPVQFSDVVTYIPTIDYFGWDSGTESSMELGSQLGTGDDDGEMGSLIDEDGQNFMDAIDDQQQYLLSKSAGWGASAAAAGGAAALGTAAIFNENDFGNQPMTFEGGDELFFDSLHETPRCARACVQCLPDCTQHKTLQFSLNIILRSFVAISNPPLILFILFIILFYCLAITNSAIFCPCNILILCRSGVNDPFSQANNNFMNEAFTGVDGFDFSDSSLNPADSVDPASPASAGSASLGGGLAALSTSTRGLSAASAAAAVPISENSFNLSDLLDAESDTGDAPSVTGTSASGSDTGKAAEIAGAVPTSRPGLLRPGLPPKAVKKDAPVAIAADGEVPPEEEQGSAIRAMAAKVAITLGLKALAAWLHRVWEEIDDDVNPNAQSHFHHSFAHQSASHIQEMEESSRNLAMGYFMDTAGYVLLMANGDAVI